MVGVGVCTSCADANRPIKADARMTQAIFIGEVMRCELSRRKCAANSQHLSPKIFAPPRSQIYGLLSATCEAALSVCICALSF